MERYNFTNPLFLFKIESMKRHFYFLFCLVFLVACDDGDIISIDLEFNKELARCENDIQSYLIYDTREDPNESLILIIGRDDANELLFTEPTTEGIPVSLPIDGTNTRFIYRSYNRAIVNDELCNAVSPADLSIREDFEANNGNVQITTTIVDDDEDGVPSAAEDLNGNGDYTDDHSDDDGIPDYLDEDDDNDNIKTKFELLDDINEDGDDDPLTDPLDTDGDGILNYLDDDDDGDGIDTRLEDITEDKNPRNTNNYVVIDGIDVFRYLSDHSSAMEGFADSGFIFNYYTRSVTTHFEILNAGLEIINSTYIDFGTFKNSFTIDNEPEED